MKKENEKTAQLFSYEVVMMIHVVGNSEAEARAELDEKGGIVTQREVTLMNTQILYGEKEVN